MLVGGVIDSGHGDRTAFDGEVWQVRSGDGPVEEILIDDADFPPAAGPLHRVRRTTRSEKKRAKLMLTK